MSDGLFAIFEELPGEPVPRLPVKKPGPKGNAPYSPRAGSKNSRILTAAQEVLVEQEAVGMIPVGSRELGYLLTYRGFTHDDVPLVEEVVERARRAGLIGWEQISDGRTSSDGPWEVQDAEDAAEGALGILRSAQLDRQKDQPVRIEVWAEAAAWITRLVDQCVPYGVTVYSGSGSVPVPACREAGQRAAVSWKDGQPTVIFTIGDFDLSGLRNIAIPFEDDVRAFAGDFGDDPWEFLAFRRVAMTYDQALALPEAARVTATQKQIEQGWPWAFTAQAEALEPVERSRIVRDAIESLQDTGAREAVERAEAQMHSEALDEMRERLD